MRAIVAVACYAVLVCIGPIDAFAQAPAPLNFPDQAVQGSVRMGTSLGKPAGDGPFPAVVILPTCSGATIDFQRWGEIALKRGYVALMVDSVGSRRLPQCSLNSFDRMRDAKSARRHVAALPYVDQGRVYLLGFSAGAGATYLTAAAGPATMDGGHHYRAAAAAYGSCMRHGPSNSFLPALPTQFFIPVLALYGDKDTQAIAKECVPQLEALKAGSQDVEWHVFPGGYHCWDCKSEHGRRTADRLHNNDMQFYYDDKITRETEAKVFEFFERNRSR